MSTKTIKAILAKDIVSRTAQDVLTANSGTPSIAAIPANKVPKYMYLCLMDLFGYEDPQQLADHITARYGLNETSADEGIQLTYKTQDPAGISDFPTEAFVDRAGGEAGYLSVMVGIHDPVDDDEDELTEQVQLRIRWLIDYNQRLYNQGAVPSVHPANDPPQLNPAGIDYTIDPKYGVVVKWLKMDIPDNALEMVSLYSVQYTRLFPSK